jgi:hypothetical protein
VQLQQQMQQEQLQQLVQQERLQQLVQQERLQQLVQQERLELQQLFRHKQSKQGPTEQQQERIISWSVSLGFVDKVKNFARLNLVS